MSILIVGDKSDIHVVAVAEVIKRHSDACVAIFDGPALQEQGFSLTLDTFRHSGNSVALDSPIGTGWLRRYGPSGWGTGTIAGSIEAITKRAFLSLVGSVTRIGRRRWLTSLDAMLTSEDRLVQLEAARFLGIRIPKTLVSSDPIELVDSFGPQFVVKPLSGGFFWTTDGPRAVFTTLLDSEMAQQLDFGSAPFVSQELLVPHHHLRVVTVGARAWICQLDAEDRPLDWRQQEEAHSSWEDVRDDEVCEQAVRLALHLGIGYSSQDWIRDNEGYAFLDLNPGGQWLFLPEPVGASISEAIAGFLMEASD